MHRRSVRTGPRSLVVAALAVAAALPAQASAQAAQKPQPPFKQQVLFKPGQDPGYACYRIPSVVKTVRGTLLAFAEGRRNDCSDAGDIDIVVKRSEDGGRTWSPLQVVNEGAGDTHGNPSPIVDRRTGRILLAETYNTGRTDGENCDVPCDRTPHMQHSDDDGRTWSTPRDLSDELLPDDFNSWYATGPSHGIQLTRGHHPGRLVFAVNAETWNGERSERGVPPAGDWGRVSANHAALMVSDDGGDHWRVGAKDSWPVADDGTFRQKPSEMALAELPDGTVHVSGREQDGSDLGHRTQAVSRDGGDSFDRPFAALPDLYAPQVQASTLPVGKNGDRLLLACPGDPDRRRTMMIRSSYDGGRTWESFDRGTVVTTDWSGYSDLVQADRDHVGLLYEGGAVDARDEIRFARFTLDWLKDRRGPDPTTDDRAPGARGAAVLGGPTATDGPTGRALTFDGTDDAIRLPYSDRLRLESREFNVSLWFRYSTTSGEQPLLSLGGTGASQPQVTLRAEPAADRITGLITARDGAAAPSTVTVQSTSAYNDGNWHRLQLRRADGRLTLSVDDAQVAEAADVPGSVSRNSPFGAHIGQRMDGRAHFTGSIDDVRVTSGGDDVLWLPLDRIGSGVADGA
ncbi:exo-alpha-sialidase [Streptomyces sp. NPDC102384]|uniref:exo-alpha-sialidase n=1 Tax=Streptomyces sp. NPDC102384 TaxID=3366166 RepID=UPI00380871B8